MIGEHLQSVPSINRFSKMFKINAKRVKYFSSHFEGVITDFRTKKLSIHRIEYISSRAFPACVRCNRFYSKLSHFFFSTKLNNRTNTSTFTNVAVVQMTNPTSSILSKNYYVLFFILHADGSRDKREIEFRNNIYFVDSLLRAYNDAIRK